MKKMLKKVSKIVMTLALVAASTSTLRGCLWLAHQPKEPKALADREA